MMYKPVHTNTPMHVLPFLLLRTSHHHTCPWPQGNMKHSYQYIDTYYSTGSLHWWLLPWLLSYMITNEKKVASITQLKGEACLTGSPNSDVTYQVSSRAPVLSNFSSVSIRVERVLCKLPKSQAKRKLIGLLGVNKRKQRLWLRSSSPKYWAQSTGIKLYPLVILKMVQQPKHLNCLQSKGLFNPGLQQEAKAGAERLPWDNLETALCQQEPRCLSKPPLMSPCYRESGWCPHTAITPTAQPEAPSGTEHPPPVPTHSGFPLRPTAATRKDSRHPDFSGKHPGCKKINTRKPEKRITL